MRHSRIILSPNSVDSELSCLHREKTDIPGNDGVLVQAERAGFGGGGRGPGRGSCRDPRNGWVPHCEVPKERGLSLRALAKLLYCPTATSWNSSAATASRRSTVVEGYEVQLGIPKGTLVGLREAAYFELHGEDPLAAPDAPAPIALPSPFQLPATSRTSPDGSRSRPRSVRLVEGTGPLGGAVVISAIAGMAGVGKTALAVHLATIWRRASRRPSFS